MRGNLGCFYGILVEVTVIGIYNEQYGFHKMATYIKPLNKSPENPNTNSSLNTNPETHKPLDTNP